MLPKPSPPSCHPEVQFLIFYLLEHSCLSSSPSLLFQFLTDLLSLSHCPWLVSMCYATVCLTSDCRLHYSLLLAHSTFLWFSYPSLHMSRLQDSPPNTELELRGKNLFSFFSKSRLKLWTPVAPMTRSWLQNPHAKLKYPPLLSWLHGHFTSPFSSESKAMPKHFWRPDSSEQWEVLPRVEAELSHQLLPSCHGPWVLLLLWSRPCQM